MKQTKGSQPKLWLGRLKKSLWVIPVLALLIKLFISTQIQGNAWLGADGENYLQGLEFLTRDGFLSKETILHYWPSGYPLLMWLVGAANYQFTLPIVVVAQSTLYAFSTAFFGQKLSETSLRRYALPTVVLLTVSPTITLNTLAIGYELISASIFLIALALFIGLSQQEVKKIWNWRILVIGAIFSINNFVQPRFILSSIVFFLILAFYLFKAKFLPIVIILGIALSLLLPSIMVIRNSLANDFSAISTNLGITMRIGAGEGATGGYVPGFTGVDCPNTEGNAAEVDRSLIQCTVDWYLDNPSETVRLAIAKTVKFWSPWFGPLASGSMGRNPWLQIHPFYDISRDSQAGYEFFYGPIGKVFSWLWMVLYLLVFGYGAFKLWRHSPLGQRLSVTILALVSVNWLISLGTLGDHRQRLPILSMIIFLQLVGITNLKGLTQKKRAKTKRR